MHLGRKIVYLQPPHCSILGVNLISMPPGELLSKVDDIPKEFEDEQWLKAPKSIIVIRGAEKYVIKWKRNAENAKD